MSNIFSLFDDEQPPLPPHGNAPRAKDAEARRLPCAWCKEPTLVATLTQYGARCFRCYEASCRTQQPSPAIGDKRKGGPKAWAHSLKAREQAGERLTPAQQAAWRDALRQPQPTEDA